MCVDHVCRRQYWKGTDEEADEKLSFEEVEKLCRRLGVMKDREGLERLFNVRSSCSLNLPHSLNSSAFSTACGQAVERLP